MFSRFIVLVALALFSIVPLFAAEVVIESTSAPIIAISPAKNLTYGQLLTMFFDRVAREAEVPESSKFISLQLRGVGSGSNLEKALKKAVYLDIFKNENVYVPARRWATRSDLGRLITATFQSSTNLSGKAPITDQDVNTVLDQIYRQANAPGNVQLKNTNIGQAPGFQTLDDVYRVLKYQHRDASTFDQKTLVQWAIKWLAEATKDPYTSYYPPIQSKSFSEQITGSFEGIGASVEMTNRGLIVLAPLPGSPAEKSGILAGDIILKAGDTVITPQMSPTEAVSYIKWPAWSVIQLTIQRWENAVPIVVAVTREKISLDFVESKNLSNGDAYIRITSFGDNAAVSFKKALKNVLSSSTATTKIIIDLRNNPGGSVEEVRQMMSLFTPKDTLLAQMVFPNGPQTILSLESDVSVPKDRKIVILVNKGSASASEMMALILRDYWDPKLLKIVGEKTFGKGSVQTVQEYDDGSILKYTVARWSSGKTKTSIDAVGLVPDIVVVDTGSAVLEKGMSLNF